METNLGAHKKIKGKINIKTQQGNNFYKENTKEFFKHKTCIFDLTTKDRDASRSTLRTDYTCHQTALTLYMS